MDDNLGRQLSVNDAAQYACLLSSAARQLVRRANPGSVCVSPQNEIGSDDMKSRILTANLNRIRLWALAVGLSSLACSGWAAETASSAAPRYNVLLLMADQHRPDALGRYGDSNAITPALDSLAAAGMSFRQAYCQTPICVASRNSILTGRYAHSTGVLSNGYKANREQTSFAQVLRSQGYKTACFGKLHTPGREDLDWDLCEDRPERHQGPPPPGAVILDTGLNAQGNNPVGAPDPFPKTETMEWKAKENTIAFMKANRDRPWLIQCSLKKPHPPFQPPKQYWDMIDRAKLEVPRYPADDLEDANPRYWQSIVRRGMDHLTDEQVRDGMQGYYGNLAFADAMFAEVLKALDELELREKTLVIYIADHGEMLYAHRLWTKMVFFDPSVRVPLIMRLPGVIQEGKETRALVESIDLFPTITELLGLATPASVQGRSLVPVLKGQTERHRDVVRSEFPNSEAGRKDSGQTMMQFDGRYKLVDNGPRIPPELYDLKTDPREITNLQALPEHRERVEKMLAELRTWDATDVAKSRQKGSRVREDD
jgi:choline-sulfatase